MSFSSGVPQGVVLHTDRIQAEGVVVRQKKKNTTQKNINFWCHALCKNGFRKKKIAKMKYFLPLPPFLQECQNRGWDAVFA